MTLTLELLATLLALSMPVAADTTTEPVAGLYAWIDPATGQPGSPDAEAAEQMRAELGLADWDVEQALRSDGDDLVVVEDAFGVLTVDLQGRFQSAVFGRVEEDGSTTIVHDEPIGAPRPRP